MRMVTAIAEEFIELIDDVTGKVVRCRKFVAPPVNQEWPLYSTNAAREREQRADATLPISTGHFLLPLFCFRGDALKLQA
jgi:hypothetical protein